MDRKSGFTLVEILVVIAIISLMIALLMPVITKGRDWAHRAVCISNLRQISLAIHAYKLDNRELPGYNWYKAPAPRIYVNDSMQTLYPDYIDTFDVFTCPSTLNYVHEFKDLRHSAYSYDGPGTSYEYLKFQSLPWGRGRSYTKGDKVHPLLHDIDSRGMNSRIDADDNHVRLGGGCMLFPDGTVEWVLADEWEYLVTGMPNP